MKKVIVISTSLRPGSNSDMLADKFAEGAKAAGNDVEKISLVGKTFSSAKVVWLARSWAAASSMTMLTISLRGF